MTSDPPSVALSPADRPLTIASPTRLIAFRLFILSMTIWVGAGVYTSIQDHPSWHDHPVEWVRSYDQPEGTTNPWPLLTALVAVTTLFSLAMFARYRGPGWREALIALFGALVVLIATGVYFVPNLITIFERTETLNDAQIIALSNAWILFNAVRIVFVLILMYLGLVALTRMGNRSTNLS